MKKLLAVLAGLLVAAALALFLLPYLIPQSYLERQLAPVLADATGLQLEEARRLRLSFVPEPGFIFEGVSARLPIDEARGPRIRADRILAEVDASSLMGGRLTLKKVIFESPFVVIGTDGAARSAILPKDFLPKKASMTDAPHGDAILVEAANRELGRQRRALRLPKVDIEIRNGFLTFDDGGSDRPPTLSELNLLLGSNREQGLSMLDGGLRLGGEPVSVKGTANVSETDNRSLALRLLLQSAAGQTDINGAFSLDDEPHFSGKAQIEIASGEALARMTGASAQTMARFDGASIAGPLEISERQLALSDAVLTAPGAEGNVSFAAGRDGVIRATLRNLALHGGRAEGTLTLDARRPDAILAGNFSMSNVDGLALSKGLSDFDWLSGRADVRIEFAGGGRTMDTVVETLTGKGSLALSDGAIEGIDLPLIVAEARDGEFRKWRREAGLRTPFDRLEASFTLEEGIARTDDLRLTGPNVTMIGEGKTNIARGRIEYRLKPTITAHDGEASGQQGGDQASLAIPLIVKGDWEKPDIYPDVENALKDTDSLRGTAKLFGKSVEKWTDGQIKADDFGKMIDGLFGKKKKKKQHADDE